MEWSDSEINQAINDAYYDLQMEVQSVNPEAIVSWDTIDITANESWYPKPPTFGLMQVEIDEDNDNVYYKLDLKEYNDIRYLIGEKMYYCDIGDWIGIFPAPSTAVTDGIRILHRPMHTLTVDTDSPKLKLPLHQAICLQAKIFLLGDTNESSQSDEGKLMHIKDRLNLLYLGSTDEQAVISPRGL